MTLAIIKYHISRDGKGTKKTKGVKTTISTMQVIPIMLKDLWCLTIVLHPDGGQLFFPKDNKPFISPLALPGDDIRINDFKAFYFDGSQGLYIHPNVWHEGVFPTKERATFRGKQGKVHARVSIDLLEEFKSYLFFKVAI